MTTVSINDVIIRGTDSCEQIHGITKLASHFSNECMDLNTHVELSTWRWQLTLLCYRKLINCFLGYKHYLSVTGPDSFVSDIDVSDIDVFVLKRDIKLQPTNQLASFSTIISNCKRAFEWRGQLTDITYLMQMWLEISGNISTIHIIAWTQRDAVTAESWAHISRTPRHHWRSMQ